MRGQLLSLELESPNQPLPVIEDAERSPFSFFIIVWQYLASLSTEGRGNQDFFFSLAILLAEPSPCHRAGCEPLPHRGQNSSSHCLQAFQAWRTTAAIME